MIKENPEKQTLEPNFPEQNDSIIENLLEKFKLKDENEKGLENFFMAENTKERKEIFENLPGTKISQIVRDYGEQRISLDEIPDLIENKLNVLKQEAEEMTKYLNENLLVLIEKSDIKKTDSDKTSFLEKDEGLTEIKEKYRKESKTEELEEEKEETIEKEKRKKSSKEDSYRELIE